MKFNHLGRTGYIVSAIAFGTWGIGGPGSNPFAYGKRDDAHSETALRTAYQLGVNLYDTSCSYGDGHAEELLGRVFREHRSRVIIATKAGYKNTFDPKGNNQSFHYQDVERSIQLSLEKLQTHYIDILQLHDCPIEAIRDNSKLFVMLESLKRSGTVRAIGFAAKSSAETKKALNIYEFDTVQIGLSLVDMRPIDEGLIETCINRGIGLIARSPLAFGFLADGDRINFAEGDHRQRFSQRQRTEWADAKKRFTSVFSSVQYTNWAQKAILFALSIHGVSSVNVGINHSWQAEQAAMTITFPLLTNEKLQEAQRIYADYYKDKPIERV